MSKKKENVQEVTKKPINHERIYKIMIWVPMTVAFLCKNMNLPAFSAEAPTELWISRARTSVNIASRKSVNKTK